MKRVYRYDGSRFMKELEKVMRADEPVFFFKLETTGFDEKKDEIIQIGALKCEVIGSEFVPVDSFSTFVKSKASIPEEASLKNGITDDMLKDAPPLAEAMNKAVDFFGTRPIVIGYNCEKFSLPFLKRAGFLTGEMIYPSVVLDILDIVRAVIPKGKGIQSYSCRAVAAVLGCVSDVSFHDAKIDSEIYLDILRKLLPMIPMGTAEVKVEKVTYWEKSKDVKFLFVVTDRGKVSINAVNGFWTEEVPGFFDEVNLDALTEYMLKAKKVSSVWELISLYEK